MTANRDRGAKREESEVAVEELEELWLVADVAKYLRCGVHNVYRLVRYQGLPCIKVGRMMFRPSEVQEWCNGRRWGEGKR